MISGKDVLHVSDFSADSEPSHGSGEENSVQAVVTLEENERRMIERAMQLHGGNLTKVAEALGLSRAALYRRLDKHGFNH